MKTRRALKLLGLFAIVAFGLFVLAGGLFALLELNSGSSRLLNRASGFMFVYPPDVNNLVVQEGALTSSLVFSVGLAAAVVFFIGIIKPILSGESQARSKAGPGVAGP